VRRVLRDEIRLGRVEGEETRSVRLIDGALPAEVIAALGALPE
jgi:hypothetical protein